MWPVVVIIFALARASMSRTDNTEFENDPPRYGISGMNFNPNDELLAGINPDYFPGLETAKYPTGIEEKQLPPPRDYLTESTGPEYEKFATIDGDEEEVNNDDDDDDDNNNNNNNNNNNEDAKLEKLAAFLARLLQEPGSWEPPLILLEESPVKWTEATGIVENPYDGIDAPLPAPWKRSRYYRRYPWKRQNSRSRYDYDGSRYLCTPTKEDVRQLLVALHDARRGNKSRTVNFCNRRRPAGSVFTNIRFLGRRK